MVSYPFTLMRGVRPGRLLSMLLYIIAAEALPIFIDVDKILVPLSPITPIGTVKVK